MSATLYTTREFMDAELEENLQRARQLCRELEDDTTLVSILVGLGRLQMVRGDHVAVADLEQEEERLAERVQDAQLLVQLHTQLATIATFRGLHARAADHYQRVLQHYDPKALSFFLPSFGGDPLVVASIWSGASVSLGGQSDLGWSRIAQALTRVEELNQPLILVNGLLCAALVKLLRGDYDEARRLAKKMDMLTCEHHFSLYKIGGDLLQASIAVHRGALEEGIAGMTAGLAQYHALGAQQLVPFFLSYLAEGYRRQGKIDEALQVVVDALNLTEINFDTFWEAELYRLKGELSLQSAVGSRQSASKREIKSKVTNPQSPIPNPHSEAEACFLKAIEIARQQGAKLLELRAVMSLVQLRQQQATQFASHNTHHETRNRLDAARNMLAEIYGWFTEGFDTEDLQTARALLAE